MLRIEPTRQYDFTRVKTLVFAGGGNRCWWQAGAVHELLDYGMRLPYQLVGTSAGAAVAAACLTDTAHTALEVCLRLYANTARIFDWRELARLKLKFAHQHVYPTWVAAFIHAGTFDAMQNSSSRLTVGLTRPARYLGMGGTIAAGTLAYLVDKYLWNSIHPRLPGMLGLRQEFVVLNDRETVEDAQHLLVAAASAPPIMGSRIIGGAPAIDGGYTDNAPIPPQSADEKSATLVLLTRHYPKLPTLFHWAGRTYWQPSRRVPVSTWDCTSKATVREAYALGESDAIEALATGLIR
jgi:predicted patatin/cPLA2 family phospholipase